MRRMVFLLTVLGTMLLLATGVALAQDGSVLAGTAGDDRLVGTGGDDRISVLQGDDIVSARGGNDVVFGGANQDRLNGGRGNDRLAGGTGEDRLIGGLGDDRINAADRGRDRVNCGPGTDVASADAQDIVLSNCETVVED